MTKYKELNDWLFEGGSGERIEQLYKDLGLEDCDDIGKYARLLVWLGNAFEAGKAE